MKTLKEKKEETALALVDDTKALAIVNPINEVALPYDLSDDDFKVEQEHEAPMYPYISIRQKAMTDETKNIEWGMGWFKINNAPEPHDDLRPPVKAVVLFWTRARTYFIQGAEQPECKSIDGINGTKFGLCENCEFGKWIEKNRPACKEGRNLYAFMEGIGPCIIRFGPSALKAWRGFDNLMKTRTVKTPSGKLAQIPWHLCVLSLDTKKITKIGLDPYWEPVISLTDFIKDQDTLTALRSLLSMKAEYDRVAKVVDLEPEDVNGHKPDPLDEVFPTVDEVREAQTGNPKGKTGNDFLDNL